MRIWIWHARVNAEEDVRALRERKREAMAAGLTVPLAREWPRLQRVMEVLMRTQPPEKAMRRDFCEAKATWESRRGRDRTLYIESTGVAKRNGRPLWICRREVRRHFRRYLAASRSVSMAFRGADGVSANQSNAKWCRLLFFFLTSVR